MSYSRIDVLRQLLQMGDRGQTPQDTHALSTIYRYRGTLEQTWRRHLNRKGNIPREVEWILTLGTYELHFSKRSHTYATVNECVELAKSQYPEMAGFVNAILKAVARDPSPDIDPMINFPGWVNLSDADRRALLEPPVFVLWNNNVCSATRSGLAELLDQGNRVQSLSSRFVVEVILQFLRANESWTYLDVCAGKGGKFLPVLESLPKRERLWATDRDPAQLRQLEHACQSSRHIRRYDETMASDETFDLILIDAPCSGSGTWQKNPRSKWIVTPSFVETCAKTQEQLLAWAEAHVSPGGVIVYSVCSLFPMEGTEHFKTRRGGLELKTHFLEEYAAMCEQHSTSGGILIHPGQGFEGFFIQAFQVQ